MVVATVTLAMALTVACGAATPAATPTRQPAAQPTRPSVPSLGPQTATPGPLKPFELPQAGGGTYRLADRLGKQPLDVVFYRGFF